MCLEVTQMDRSELLLATIRSHCLCHEGIFYLEYLTFNQAVAGSISARPTKYQALTRVLKFSLSHNFPFVP